MVNDIRPAPDVTVVIPTRDREAMLARAVRSCIEFHGPGIEVEVLVSLDGERPGYAAGLASEHPRVVILESTVRGGRGWARNRGLKAATGRFVKFLDDDDWLEPGSLKEEVRLAEASGADIVASGHWVRGEGVEDRYFPPPPLAEGIDSILRGEAVPTAAALYRRESIGSVLWDERSPKLDDWQFFVKVALRPCRIVPLSRPSYTWWSHSRQSTARVPMLDNAKEFFRVLDEIEKRLAEIGELSERRKRRLAQYRYKELRVLCRFDRPCFEAEILRILSLDDQFVPRDEERKRWMRWLSRLIGFRRANLLLVAVKSTIGLK